MLDYPEVVVRLTLWCIVVGLIQPCWMTLIGVLWFPSRAITQMHQALNDRLDDAISHLTDGLAPLPETRGLKERRWRCKTQCLLPRGRCQLANSERMVAKLRGNGNLHLLDAESLIPLFADSQAIIEFRQN